MTALFSTPKMPDAPKPTPPAIMPDALSPEVLAARRKAQQDMMARAGRSSTILTAPKNAGGPTPAYSSTALGAGASS